jgi:hypothetical protein
MPRLFLEGVGNKRKCNIMDYETLCKSRGLGGLGILNSQYQAYEHHIDAQMDLIALSRV